MSKFYTRELKKAKQFTFTNQSDDIFSMLYLPVIIMKNSDWTTEEYYVDFLRKTGALFAALYSHKPGTFGDLP